MSWLSRLFTKKPEVEVHIEQIERFKVLETFTAVVDGNAQTYQEGKLYNIREDNHILKQAVKQFIKAGVVEMTNNVAKVSGRGIVK